jgi:hypothetical protein
MAANIAGNAKTVLSTFMAKARKWGGSTFKATGKAVALQQCGEKTVASQVALYIFIS